MHMHVYSNIRYIDFKHDIFYIISEIHKLVQIKSIYWIHMVLLLFLDGVTLFFLEKCYSCRKEKAPYGANSFL